MEGRVKVLLVLLVFASVLFAGCSGGQPETSGGGEQAPTPTEAPSGGESGGSGGSPYDTANEVSPPPEAQDIHNTIKPILESVFGGAKLTGYLSGQGTGGKGISLVYVVKEPIDATKAQAVVNKIKAEGYSSVYGGLQDDGFGFLLQKDNKMLMIGGTLNEYEITVIWGEGIS